MIVSPDAQNQVDPTLTRNLFNHMPELGVPIVPISFFANFTFRHPGNIVRYVVVDFTEGGCDTEEYLKFWNWYADNPPILTFTRELKQADATPVRLPIEFPAYLPIPEPQNEQDFNSRPIEVLNWWGYSHQSRPKLHARICEAMNEGIEVLTHWEQWPTPSTHPRKWATLHTPHWVRRQMSEILPWMERSKITVALPGNGAKTFRHGECINTIMATWEDGLAWSYPWNNSNSIQLIPFHEFTDLNHVRGLSNLYEIYRNGVENMRHYYSPCYANDYVAAEIRKVL